ncbi:MAG: HD domain-containing protein, partial [Anaerolineae bacterium]|nr:HD domain-containing protein [Anaerolineae bacterium]
MITIEEARSHYQDNDASHDFEHVRRVLRMAERIGAAEGAEMLILRTAALLHDVAREEKRRSGICHAQAGAKRARTILAGHPEELVIAVAEAIATHRYRADAVPQSLEAQILYDADKLDAIGAIGVAR